MSPKCCTSSVSLTSSVSSLETTLLSLTSLTTPSGFATATQFDFSTIVPSGSPSNAFWSSSSSPSFRNWKQFIEQSIKERIRMAYFSLVVFVGFCVFGGVGRDHRSGILDDFPIFEDNLSFYPCFDLFGVGHLGFLLANPFLCDKILYYIRLAQW